MIGKSKFGISLGAGLLLSASWASGQSIWTDTTTGGNWSTSTWTNGVPTEGSSTTVTFYSGTSGAASTVTASLSATIDSGVTGGNGFDLQSLVLNGRGDGTSRTVTINSGTGAGGLNFVGTSNSITFNNPALGGSTDMTYNISAAVSVTNGLTITANDNPLASGSNYNRIGGVISGSGGVTKNGSGRFTFNGNNTFSGGLTINGGNTTLNVQQSYTGGTTLNGGAAIFSTTTNPFSTGTITLNGGTFAATNTPTLSNAILIGGNLQIIDQPNIAGSSLNLTGTVNLQGGTRTLFIAGTTSSTTLTGTGNTLTMTNAISNGGILKDGRGSMNLTGSNSYAGGTYIKDGIVRFGTNASIPASGMVTIGSSGALGVNITSGDTTVSAWLANGKLTNTSSGAIAIAGNSSENIDFTGYNSLFFGATAAANYTGTLTAAGGTYRLGGGSSTMTFTNANTLTGSNNMIAGTSVYLSPVGYGTVLNNTLSMAATLGTVSIAASQDMSGTTTVNSGSLTLTGAGGLVNSDITVNRSTLNSVGAGFIPLAITGGSGTTVRAKSITLNATTMTVTGTAANSDDQITNALTAGSGLSTITLTPNAAANTVLTAGSLTRSAGAALLVRGTGFGTNSIASQTANTSNVVLGSTPTFIGSSSTSGTTMRILPWAIGDASATGTGTDFLTYDSTTGLRMLASGEYLTSFSSGNATQDNAKITANVSLAAATTLNSLTINGAATTVSGAGTLTLSSGGLLVTSVATGATLSSGLAFGANEGMITTASGSSLNVSGGVSGTGGLSKNGSGTLTMSGSKSFSGPVVINSGTYSTSSLANGGSNSGVGSSSNAATNLTLNGGTLSYTGGTASTDRLFSVGIGGGSIQASGSGALTFTNTGAIGFNGESGARSLTLRGTGTGTLAAVIGDNGGATSVMKWESGTWNLTGTSTYTGGTYIVGDANNSVGTLATSFLADGGQASGIGASSNDAGNLVIARGTFKYTGAAVSTDRLFSLGSAGGGGTIDASGTGAVNFTNTGAMGFLGGGGTRTLTLSGTNTGDNTLAAAITNSGPGEFHTTAVTKSGAGTWVLAGTNTYTGGTTVSAGTLKGTTTSLQGAITNNSAVVFDQTTDGTYSGAMSGTGTVTKSGSGSATFSGSNSYTGSTTLTAGTLVVSGNLSGTSGIAVNGGTFNYTNNSTGLDRAVTVSGGNFKYNSSQAYTGSLVFTSGTISGSGNLSTISLAIGSGKTLSPGNSPGTLSTGAQSWDNGGSYLWEINALATSTVPGSEGANPGWDLTDISGVLAITAGTGQFNLNVDSLLALDNWNDGSSYQWRIATASGGVTGFSADAFNINTAAFSDQNPFTGTFSVSNVGNDVFLNYTAVPEPATYAMVGMGLGVLWIVRRKRKVA